MRKQFKFSIPLAALLGLTLAGGPAFGSGCVEFIGNWPFGYGYDVDYDEARNIAFCGSGGGVFILDIADLSNITALSDKIRLEGRERALFYDATTQRLYVGGTCGEFQIWNTSNPSNPMKLGDLGQSVLVSDIVVSDSFAYILSGKLKIINVSDPTVPFEVGHCDVPDHPFTVAVSNSFAYVIDKYQGLVIIDITDPSSPFMVTSLPRSERVEGVAVRDSFAYIADGYNGLTIVNVADATNPFEVGFYNTADLAVNIALSGSYAYVSDRNDGTRIINISDPTAPYEVSSIGGGENVSVSDSFAYVCGGFGIYDISTPSSPLYVGGYGLPGYVKDVAFVPTDSSMLYFITWDGSIYLLDISDPTFPTLISKVSCGSGASSITINDTFAYIGRWQRLNPLDIFDITNPALPTFVADWNYIGEPGQYGLDVEYFEPYLYLVGRGFSIVDVSNPTSIIHTGFMWDPYSIGGYDVKLLTIGDSLSSDSLAYMADGVVILVIDISDPTNPNLVTSVGTADYYRGLAISGSYLYATCGATGMEVYDISTPDNPIYVATCNTPCVATKIAICDSFAYIADGGFEGGFCEIDITDPTNPVQIGYYDPAGTGENVAVKRCPGGGHLIFLAVGDCGVTVLKDTLGAVGIEEEKKVLSSDIDFLLQNFPNPFSVRGKVNISYSISKKMKVKLDIYDAAGRLMKTLVDGVEEPGSKLVEWHSRTDDGSTIPNGVYFCRLEAEGISQTRKLVVLR
ncbi:MAG: T9SS type A sorting domain-containing protein [bacterium]